MKKDNAILLLLNYVSELESHWMLSPEGRLFREKFIDAIRALKK